MSETTLASLHSWLAEPMEPAVKSAIDRLRRTEDVRRIAVMPDVHLATDVCIGTVIATSRLLFPAAVGADIGCGMLAMAFDADAGVLADPVRSATLLKTLYAAIPSTRRHRARTIPWPAELRDARLSHASLDAIARSEGQLQLGTLGGGNHFIEFQSDEDDRLWLMIHSGSRCMGQAVRGFHLTRAMRTAQGMLALDADTTAGQAYLHDVAWASRYADANRRAMADAVVDLMAQTFAIRHVDASLIRCDHNHVACEEHFGEQFWIHRKGAMPAGANIAGVLPGSMGTLSYHVQGRGCAEAMRSSAHGAGRALSREKARRKVTARDLCRQMQGVWFDHRMAQSLRDEAPAAYKDVRAVLRAQHDLIRVTRTLRPLLSFKGP
jgi:tRNA-splicing ligase RtcB (3'-phosphate/5'-hydroxy nucleic acid ligase)